MPRFRISLVAKHVPGQDIKGILRGVIRDELKDIKVKTTGRVHDFPHSNSLPYVSMYITFEDDSVTGWKDWSEQHLDNILSTYKSLGVEAVDSPTHWRKTPPPFIYARVDETIQVETLAV